MKKRKKKNKIEEKEKQNRKMASGSDNSTNIKIKVIMNGTTHNNRNITPLEIENYVFIASAKRNTINIVWSVALCFPTI